MIKKLGGTPKADVKTPEVKTTKENLEAAIAGESYERDTMYPEFIAKARKDANKDALETFNFAKAAEAEHAKMYTDALARLDALKGTKAMTYYVCTVCGFTTTKLDFQKCSVCFNPKDKYTPRHLTALVTGARPPGSGRPRPFRYGGLDDRDPAACRPGTACTR